MFRSRLGAYRLFKWAMLVTVFLTTDVQFYRVQFYALLDLLQAVTALVVINALIHREMRHLHAVQHPEPATLSPAAV